MNYHANYSRLSRTMLKHFRDSRRLFEAYYVTQTLDHPPPSKAMKLGTLVHAMLLEPHTLTDKLLVIPKDLLASNGAESTKAAKDFRKQHEAAGVTVCKTEDELINVRCMVASALELLGPFMNSQTLVEHVIEWTDLPTGLECRLKADIITELPDMVLAFDLKSSDDVTPSTWAHRARGTELWLQERHYSAGLKEQFLKPVRFLFGVVESKGTNRAAMFELEDDEHRDNAYDQTLAAVAECKRTDNWAEPWERIINRVSMRQWDYQCDSITKVTT
jgi:exodeoxyribonuclease VIII